MKKRILSMLLTLTMMLSLFPGMTVTASAGGTVNMTVTTENCTVNGVNDGQVGIGEEYCFQVEPLEDYVLTSVTVDGVEPEKDGDDYSFTVPDHDFTVAAKAVLNLVNMTVTTENCSVDGICGGQVLIGDELSFAVTPDVGYVISSVKANGVELTANDNEYSFTVPAEDFTVEAICVEKKVAMIGEQSYPSLAAAIAACPGTEAAPASEATTVKLLEDTVEAVTVAKGQNIVLDLNGKNLSAVGSNIVTVNGTMTLTDSSEDKSGSVNYIEGYFAIQIYGSFTMEEGTLFSESDSVAIKVEGGGNCNVVGGTIISGDDGAAAYVNYGGTLCIAGGKITGDIFYENANAISFSITGGLFSAQPESGFIHADYECVSNTDAATKTAYPYLVRCKYDAMVGDNKFTTFAEAVTAANLGADKTVVLLRNVVLDKGDYALSGLTIEESEDAKLEITGGTFDIDVSDYINVNCIVTRTGEKYTVDWDYFTVTSDNDSGFTITLKLQQDKNYPLGASTFDYRTMGDGGWGEWTKNYAGGTAISVDKAIQFRGVDGNKPLFLINSDGKVLSYHYFSFSDEDKVSLSGSIMTLLAPAYRTDTIPADNGFANLFYKCTAVTSAAGLRLPATTLAKHCYNAMFRGCNALTEAPALPATTLAERCYCYMFYNCSSLTKAPALPATTLAERCYYGMFTGCKELTEAPELPATTLTDACYFYMFSGCSSLTKAPVLSATEMQYNCYKQMFSRCSSLTEAPELPATTLASGCYYQMFQNCTALTVPADMSHVVTLADDHPDGSGSSTEGCCQAMYKGCTSLHIYTEDPSNYRTAWKATSATPGANQTDWATDMFTDCANTELTTPTAGTTYYYYNPDYLTFTADSEYKVVLFKSGSPSTVYLQYSTDKKDWTDLPLQTAVTVDKKNSDNKYVIYFRNGASGDEYKTNKSFASSGNAYYYFGFPNPSGNVPPIAASGNIMTLLDYKKSDVAEIEMGDYAFYSLFYKCSTLTAAPELPATNLSAYCYNCMFYGCTALTAAPKLPATTLANYCYFGMFNNCKALTTAPELPATILKDSCYGMMFSGCSSLTAAPKLAAATLANSCYNAMFNLCYGLYVKAVTTAEDATWTIPAAPGVNTPVNNMTYQTAAGGDTVAAPESGSNYYKVVPAYTLSSDYTGLPNGKKGSVSFKVNSKTAKTAAEGITVTAAAGSIAGYKATLTAVDADGQTVTVGTDGTFTMPGKPVTVTATYAPEHTHSFTYSAEGGVITATCSSTDGTCALTEKKVSVTLSAADAGYTGEAYTGASLDSTAWTAAGLSAPTVKYVGRDGTSYTESDTAPTAAGKYTAKITVDTATASVDFVIGAAVIPASPVDAYYATLAEAVEAAVADDTVVLLSDVTVTEGITVDKTFILNLYENTITYAPTYTKAQYQPLFAVKNSGQEQLHFTINGEGTINGPTGDDAAKYDGKAMITVEGNSVLYYEDGTLTCGGKDSDGMYGIYALNGGILFLGTGSNDFTITSWFAAVGTNHDTAPAVVYINKGTYTSQATPSEGDWWDYFCAPVYAAAAGEFTIEGGTFNGYYGISTRYGDVEQTVKINGGDFSGVTKSAIFCDDILPSASSEAKVKTLTKKAALDITAPDGYFWDENTTLVSESKVAKITTDDVTVYYDTLAEAVAAAAAGDTVKLLSDITVTEGITVDKSFELNLNSKTLTYAPAYTKAEYKSLFTVKGSSVENKTSFAIGGNGTIAGPTGEAAAKYDGKAMITVDSFASLMYRNGTMTCGGKGSDGMYGVYVLNGGAATLGSTFVGPSITSWFACVGTNHDTAPATVTIGKVTFTSLAEPSEGDWWDYFCAPVYAAAAGKYTIEGGTFNGYYGISSRYGDVEQTVTVNGGTFNTTKSAILYDKIIPSGSEAKVKTLTKKANLTTLAAPDGYFWDENTTLVSTSTAAKIGTVYYDTLAEAVAAAQEDDIIKLISDTTVTEGITVEKTLSLDLNGKTLTYAPTYTKAEYKSLFTVKGSSEESKVRFSIGGNGTIAGPTGEAAAKYDGKAMITVDSYAELGIKNGTLTCGGKGSDGMYGVYVLNGGIAAFGTETDSPTITAWFAAVGTNHDTAPANVTINNGTFTSLATPSEGDWWNYFCAPVYAAAAGEFTIDGGTFNGYYGVSSRYGDVEQTIEITGGDFSGVTKSAILYDTVLPSASSEAKVKTLAKPAELVVTAPDGYFWDENTTLVSTSTEAKITTDAGTVYYDTLAEAVAAAQNEDEIKLLCDVTVTEGIDIDKIVGINLNKKTITYTPTYTKAEYKSLFTVKGTDESKAKLTFLNTGTIAGPTEEAAAKYDGKAMITVDSNAELIFNGCKLTCGGKGADGMYGVYVLNGGNAKFGTKSTAPSITSWFACVGTNHDTAPATVSIYKGTFTSLATPSEGDWWDYFCAPVYAAAAGDYTIDGGTFIGYYGISSRYGDIEQTVEINGGDFSGVTKSAILYDTILPSASSEAKTKTLTKKADLTTLAAPEGWYWKKGASNSEPLTLTAMTTPDTPAEAVEGTHYTINYKTEKMNAESGYELAEKNGEEYTVLKTNAKVTPCGTYYVRVKGTETSFPSGWVEFTVESRPEAPAALTEADIIRTDTSVTFKNVTKGEQYIIYFENVSGGKTFYSIKQYIADESNIVDGNMTVSGLAALTETLGNSFYVGKVLAATDTSFASYTFSGTLIGVNLLAASLKSAPAAAPELTLSDCTVTDTAITLPVSGTPNTYEYAVKPESGDPVWSDTYEYTALTPATGYTYLIRVKETDDAMPSAVTELAVYTKPTTPTADNYIVDPSTLVITTTPATGFELAVKPDGEGEPSWSDIPEAGLQLESDVTYLLRVKANGNVPASDTIEFQTKFTAELSVSVTGQTDSYKFAWTGEKFDTDNFIMKAMLDTEDVTSEITAYSYEWYSANATIGETPALSEAPTAVGAYKVVISVDPTDPLYKGSVTVDFTILPAEINENDEPVESEAHSYDKTLNADVTFSSSADFNSFLRVTMEKDGVEGVTTLVENEDYTAVSGSIDVTILESFLDKLDSGRYTFKIVSGLPGTQNAAAEDGYDVIVSVPYTIEIGSCKYTEKISLQSGEDLTLVIGDKEIKGVTLEKSGSGWVIKQGDKYVSFNSSSKTVSLSAEATVWSYNGGFYMPVSSVVRILFFWSRTTTTNYYLTLNADGSFGTSTSKASVEVSRSIETTTHSYEYIYLGDEQHALKCTKCGSYSVECEGCEYGNDDLCIHCSHRDPSAVQITAKVSVVKTFSGSRLIRWLFGSYAYTATVSAQCVGDQIAAIQYSTDGSTYYTGTTYTSYSAINTLYVKVKTVGGIEACFKYENGQTVSLS